MTILGFTPFTWFHIVLSLVMLVAGFVVVRDLLRSHVDNDLDGGVPDQRRADQRDRLWLPVRSVHRIPLHRDRVALIALAAAILGLYVFKLAGAWRWIFALSVVLAFYTDALVTIAQIFKKVPALGAPTASNEPQFVIAQLILLAIIIWLCVKAYRQFRPA